MSTTPVPSFSFFGDLRRHAKRNWRGLAAHWAMSLWGIATFCLSLFLVEPSGAIGLLPQIFGVTLIGQLLGNLLGLLRPRFWIVLILVCSGCVLQVVSAPVAVNPLFVFAWFMAPFCILTGYYAVRHSSEIIGSWIPIMWAVCACLVWSESRGKLSTWLGGSKYAFWDVVTLGVMVVTLLLFVVYLVVRQSQAMTFWQEANQLPSFVLQDRKDAPAPARVTWTTWGCVGVIALLLTVATLIISPYLFRTVEKEGKGDGQNQSSQGQGGEGQEQGKDGKGKDGKGKDGKGKGGQDGQGQDGKGKDGKGKDGKGKDGKDGKDGKGKDGKDGKDGKGKDGKGKDGKSGQGKDGKDSQGKGKDGKGKDGKGKGKGGGGSSSGGGSDSGDSGDSSAGKDDADKPFDPPDPDWDKVEEGTRELMNQGIDLVSLLLILLAVLVAIYFVFYRPIRRLATLRHMEKPAWPVPTTERIQALWSRALIALNDAGFRPAPSESPTALAARAHAELTRKHGEPPVGLNEAAAIFSRVQYNLGVQAEDPAHMAAAVELLVNFVNERSSPWQQVKNLYSGRRAPAEEPLPTEDDLDPL